MESPLSQKILVASQNPVKIAAALTGFSTMLPNITFTALGISVPSGVSEQPFTDAETLQGALNRAHNARELEPAADYWVGIEGGVEDTSAEVSSSGEVVGPSMLQSFAWVVVLDRTASKIGKARTAAYYQPEEVAQLVRGGMELGDADDAVFGRINSKQANGNVGLLTDDAITRTTYYVQAVVLALIPFKNVGLTF